MNKFKEVSEVVVLFEAVVSSDVNEVSYVSEFTEIRVFWDVIEDSEAVEAF